MAEGHVVHPFSDAAQQEDAAGLGMWVFLTTEVLFFGGLFLAYTVYRVLYPGAFEEASTHLYPWIATANTAVLLTSSLCVVLAVHAAASGERRRLVAWLGAAALLGCAFLGLKGYEYVLDVHEGLAPAAGFAAERFREPARAELFFVLYWVMTGLHAIHVLVGVGVLSALAALAHRGRFSAAYFTPVEVGGLYWHFVDVVWCFLLPLLYLAA